MAYGTLADWQAYALARGNSAPTNADSDDANAALVRASDYIRSRYVIRLAEGYDETDERVVEATYIAASIELATPGFFFKTYTPSDKKVLTKVEGIEWKFIGGYGQPNPSQQVPVSPMIEALLYPILNFTMGIVVV